MYCSGLTWFFATAGQPTEHNVTDSTEHPRGYPSYVTVALTQTLGVATSERWKKFKPQEDCKQDPRRMLHIQLMGRDNVVQVRLHKL
jgi:hypothetical protein